APGRPPASPSSTQRPTDRGDRAVRKEIATLERTIQRLDAEKRERQAALLAATDPDDALRLHGDMTAVADKLAAAEERWLALQEQLGQASA
ncbi:MAG: ABC transporter C-terminal domain-containing protein, partial [Planctomycetia bacterium]